MQIRVDSELCCGHGRCYTVSPDVFSPDDEGYPEQLDQTVTVPRSLLGHATAGAEACPERAISILETSDV